MKSKTLSSDLRQIARYESAIGVGLVIVGLIVANLIIASFGAGFLIGAAGTAAPTFIFDLDR